jgi:hypothetical protein
MRDFNVNREPISSEEISTFKDFKSILRKHAQTTEDLAKIKNVEGSSNFYWGLGGALSAIAIISVMLLSNTDEEVSDQSTNSVLIVNEVKEVLPEIKWETVIRTPKVSLEDALKLNVISADRVDFVKFSSKKEVSILLPKLKGVDVDFIKESLVFRIENEESIEISNANTLYQLTDSNEWIKVDYTPNDIPFIEKPRLLKPGTPAIQMDFEGFSSEFTKFEEVFWQPVDFKDLDEKYFTVQWDDASVEKSNVNGVYKLSFRSGEIEQHFNGYPVLQKVEYEKAIKLYKTRLMSIQEKLMIAPKNYIVSKGVFTVK